MEKTAQEEWYLQFVKQHELTYGCVPPPWEAIPGSHPSSMRWRMGYGESLLSVFPKWLKQYFPSEESRIAFFWKHPPPPRWQPYLVAAIFEDLNLDDKTGVYDEGWYEQSGYPAKLKALGFKETERFIDDFNDPQWLEADKP